MTEMDASHEDNDLDMSSWHTFDSFSQAVFRRLAGEKEDGSIDYTVLTVAVLTLGLLLIVEFFRHKIDHLAVGRPFFSTVLEGVYRELATLGIVEFGIYLFQSYYSGYNKEAKQLFADVHFMLFFAALFNALESVLLAFFTGRVSNRLWVKTEQLDVDNYLELREEYEKVNEKLAQARHESIRADRTAEVAFEWNLQGINFMLNGVRDAVRNPRLNRKHHNLLVQVRFHELRVHFLKANNLPLNLKVSDYLKRSEMHVLKKMVHIKPFSWLLLTGGLNLLYFLMGIVAYVTEDLGIVGTSMSTIFICSLFAMVFVSLAIFNKVKRVYRGIMNNKLIDCVVADEEGDTEELAYQKKQEQMQLFWGGEPKYIIGMMQLMQIGFALSLSILIVFPDEIDGRVKTGYYALLVGLANVLFVYIGARVIPRYTLCTSLGQLVDKRRLQETLAAFHLKEAMKKQRILKDVREAEKEYELKQAQEEAKFREQRANAQFRSEQDLQEKWLQGGESADEALKSKSTRSLLSALALEGTSSVRKKGVDDMSDLSASDGSLNRVLLSELTETKTEDLRSSIPTELLPNKSSNREERIKARRGARKKAVSDGVASMRLMRAPFKMSGAAQVTLNSVNEDEDKVTASSAPPVPAVVDATTGDLTRKPSRRRDRARRKKSLSANAAIELMSKVAALEDIHSEPPLEKRSDRKPSSPPLNPLLEDIPVMTVPASELSIPVGRSSLVSHDLHQMFATENHGTGGSTNVVTFHEPQMASKASDSLLATESSKSLDQPLHSSPEHVSEVSGLRTTVRFSQDTVASDVAHQTDVSLEGTASAKGDEAAASDRDDNTVDTAGSDDGHSDVDDIPEIDPDERNKLDFLEPVKSLDSRCRDFFQGRVYRHMSAVFGTMVCFFLVGMRVESLLHAANTVDDPGNTWELSPGVAFWLETSWLCMFIMTSSLIVVLFRSGKSIPYKNRMKMSVAGIVDILLCSLCLFLLMLSETKRECDNPDRRTLAESAVSCTQMFGNRVGDGVGNIEPFTSLVALRLLRFFVARKLVRFLCRKNTEFQGSTDRVSFHLGIYDETVRSPQGTRASGSQNHDRKGLRNETGTFAELWNCGMTMYPEVVEEHGEFSGELLQAMLGLEVLDAEPSKQLPPSAPSESSHENLPLDYDTDQGSNSKGGTSSRGKPLMSLRGRYSKLSAGAQSVILAGKVGKPVRSVSDASQRSGVNGVESPNRDDANMSPTLLVDTPDPTSLVPIEFEVDVTKHATEVSTANNISGTDSSVFIAPNARLIRSMRRCDKKLLPLLDMWTTVDVVMTKFEIVYFEAPTVLEDGELTNGEATIDELAEKAKSVRQAVIATSGGKGLRLCDAAEGRKVVGHLELSSVEAVTVERSIPKREAPNDFSTHRNLENVADEFWKPRPSKDIHISGLPTRKRRWELVKEDHLIVDSIHGMLHLRFYSDLDDAEMNQERLWNEREEDGEIFKNNALQWCQTVVRLCGTTQLKKQQLSHFGSDNSDELRDYIVIDDHNLNEMHRISRANKMRRSKSVTSLKKLARGTSIGDQSSTAGSKQHRGSMLDRKSVKAARGSSVGDRSSDAGSTLHRKTRSVSGATSPSAGGNGILANMV